MPTEDRRNLAVDESPSIDLSYNEIKAQRDRLLRERDVLIEACGYLAGLQGRRHKLKLAVRTLMLKAKR